MIVNKKRIPFIALTVTCGFVLLSWDEVEAATTECASDSDCSTGEFCILALTPPICKPPQEIGAPCKRDVVCASQFCDIPADATAGVCAPAPAAPVPTCASDSDCSSGEFCILALTPPICKPPQEIGAPCKRDVVCASQFCEIPADATAGVCAL